MCLTTPISPNKSEKAQKVWTHNYVPYYFALKN